MVKAYVLIETEGRNPGAIASDMTSLEEVENVNLIYGEYDLIALVKTKNLIDLREVALEKLAKIHGVIKTSSLIIADDE